MRELTRLSAQRSTNAVTQRCWYKEEVILTQANYTVRNDLERSETGEKTNGFDEKSNKTNGRKNSNGIFNYIIKTAFCEAFFE